MRERLVMVPAPLVSLAAALLMIAVTQADARLPSPGAEVAADLSQPRPMPRPANLCAVHPLCSSTR